MKGLNKKVLSVILALMMISSLLGTTASAVARSSAYLDAYRAVVTPVSNGAMVISVQVAGVGYMPELGAKLIYLYESTDGKLFSRVATYESSDYPEMMGSGTMYYKDLFTYQGTPGRYYYAKVFVYAGDSTGGDERVYTTTTQRAVKTVSSSSTSTSIF